MKRIVIFTSVWCLLMVSCSVIDKGEKPEQLELDELLSRETPPLVPPDLQPLPDVQPLAPPDLQPLPDAQPLLPIFVRVTLDSVYCTAESSGLDRGTYSDEPYFIATAFASHRDPLAWSTGDAQVFGGVDSGENRRFDPTRPARVVFEGWVPVGATIGFSVLAVENDDWYDNAAYYRRSLASRTAKKINTELGNIPQWETHQQLFPPLTAAARRAYKATMASGPWTPGPGDDWIEHNITVLKYRYLRNLAQATPVQPLKMTLDGGGEGRYRLRWHIEFDQEASSSFDARFTHWDELVVANILGGPEAEIITITDEDAAGNLGLARVYDHRGQVQATFATLFTPYDRVAIGNVRGGPDPEIMVAHDDYEGGVQIFSTTGATQFAFDAPFTKYDGLAVGNVTGDAREEILIARDDDNKVYIFDGINGQQISQFSLSWNFNGARYTNSTTRHEVFLVGDVVVDSLEEIVMIDKDGSSGRVYVYNSSGSLMRLPFTVFFTGYDAAILADITGDDKKELVIATDPGDGSRGYRIIIYDISTGLSVTTRSWPLFTKYDGFAAGQIVGDGKEEIVLATDEDDQIYISK